MFENLTQRMTRIVKTLRGQARLTESNTQAMLREVRMALLEADVALPVVQDFIAKVKEKALGEEVVSSLTPSQALVGVVQRELTAVMGGSDEVDNVNNASGTNNVNGVNDANSLNESKVAALDLSVIPPAVILLAGLQGSGKTTTAGKLAKLLRETQKKKILTVSCDIYRPAAIAQLKTLTEQAGVDFFATQPDVPPVDIARAALAWAKKYYYDVLIVDTAGRLGIDEAMMAEITALHTALHPAETLFVIDAMLGQDAINVAKAFNDALPITGIVLAKLDGDARGGAALSVRQVIGRPIKFAGVSEKLDGLEVFYPSRMAERILGMGDIVAFVEEAKRGVDQQAAKKLAVKMKKGGHFNLNDFKAQLSQLNQVSSLSSLFDKLPLPFQQNAGPINLNQTEKQMRRMEGIINSMTPTERAKPELIKASRKRRIATGAGVQVQEVNRMLAQFEQMRGMVKKLKGGNLTKMMRGMKGLLPGMR